MVSWPANPREKLLFDGCLELWKMLGQWLLEQTRVPNGNTVGEPGSHTSGEIRETDAMRLGEAQRQTDK